ncbi:MAG TPA: site-specific DNA-methyltransferase, partial [Chitinophagales bacterium]|nr:site-specific DNA-methyltransferase [Chitinophagales bacterium]
MAKIKKTTPISIEQYDHKDKRRLNNPPVGLVDEGTEPYITPKKTYQYDPHLDPQLQWAGKAEHTAFDVPTVSLHVHERIDPRRIIETVRKQEEAPIQMSLFETHKKPLREAIEFYKHKENWTNRLIAGDSLLVMNSLLEKEGMAGKVQMVYFDPPYGIKYGSNFQPFVNKRDVKDGNDDDLTAEPEMIKAFRDTWELGIHSYLTYLRDRLLLARELLHDTGSIFVQISDENVHRVRCIMDEVFGSENFVSMIAYATTSGFTSNTLSRAGDYILWYAKDSKKVKYRKILISKRENLSNTSDYRYLKLSNGDIRLLNNEEKKGAKPIPENSKIFRLGDLTSQGPPNEPQPFNINEKIYEPSKNRHWTVNYPSGMQTLLNSGRIYERENTISFIRYFDDFSFIELNSIWDDTSVAGQEGGKLYVVQTNEKVIQRCLLMTTDPGDLVLDITCGSGTTAYVAENWGRRWITCDTSRVALALAKQRLMTALFDYYQLAHPHEGVGSGFKYKTVPHITLKSIANNEPAPVETLYDQPYTDNKRTRVTGPFTIEAVPAPVAKSFEEVETDIPMEADNSVSRSGETLRQNNWIDELKQSGVRGKKGERIMFTRMEPMTGTRFLQAHGETKVEMPPKNLFEKEQPTLMQQPQRVVVCFGPEHAPLEQRMVELALEEARMLRPKPDIILFCAFHFDAEARKDIEETNWPGITLLEAQMNADLLTDDLKKKRSSNESFWLIGQPDVQIREIKMGDDKGKYTVEVNGFDYYNPKTGTVDSGGKSDIAMWMLDHDYDGRSLFPSQVFFPMAGAKQGWATLAKNLKAEIDEEKLEAFSGTVSL